MAEKLEKIPEIRITQKVEANAVFAVVSPKYISLLQEEYFFYIWNEETSEVRWMASFDMVEEDIEEFVRVIQEIIEIRI